MAVTSVIKYEGDNKTFIWKYPYTDFNMGSELIVRESQEALFFYNGELLDKFGAGKHILETENMPLTKGFFKLATGGKNPFIAELYFVNMTEQMAIRWGTDSKIEYLDPVYNFPLAIGACGELSVSVNHPAKLLIKLVGTENGFSQEQLTIYFRAILMNRAKSIIASEIINKKISVFEIDMHLNELSDAVRKQLVEDFMEYGLNLNTFMITTVVKPDDSRNYQKFKDLYFRQHTDVMEAELKQRVSLIEQETKAKQTVMEAEAIAKKRELENYTYQQEKGFEVAKKMADNDAIAQMNNVGLGLGMMMGVGSEVGKTVGGMTKDAIQSVKEEPVITPPVLAVNNVKRFCMNCGKPLSPEALFCEYCGKKVETEDKCSGCGYVFHNDARFCPKCGTKRGE